MRRANRAGGENALCCRFKENGFGFLRNLDPDAALPIEGDALRAGMFAHRYVRTRDDWMQVSPIAPAPLDRIYFERSRGVVIGTIQ